MNQNPIQAFDSPDPDTIASAKFKISFSNRFEVTRKIIINSNKFKNYTDEEQEFIILHELMHIKQNHGAISLATFSGLTLTTLCCIIAAFALYKPNCTRRLLNYVGKISVSFATLHCLRPISSFLLAQLSQRQEYEADRLAFMVQKDCLAACSALEKHRIVRMYL